MGSTGRLPLPWCARKCQACPACTCPALCGVLHPFWWPCPRASTQSVSLDAIPLPDMTTVREGCCLCVRPSPAHNSPSLHRRQHLLCRPARGAYDEDVPKLGLIACIPVSKCLPAGGTCLLRWLRLDTSSGRGVPHGWQVEGKEMTLPPAGPAPLLRVPGRDDVSQQGNQPHRSTCCAQLRLFPPTLPYLQHLLCCPRRPCLLALAHGTKRAAVLLAQPLQVAYAWVCSKGLQPACDGRLQAGKMCNAQVPLTPGSRRAVTRRRTWLPFSIDSTGVWSKESQQGDSAASECALAPPCAAPGGL